MIWYDSIPAFTSLVGIPVGNAISVVRIKICVVTAAIKNCKLIIKKEKKEHDKIVLLANTKLNKVEVLISNWFKY